MEESSLKRFGIAAGKTIREYLNCSAEFLEGIAEGMGDVTELTARLSKAMESPLPACTCGRAPMGSTRCNVCQHDLGCARHNASPCKIP